MQWILQTIFLQFEGDKVNGSALNPITLVSSQVSILGATREMNNLEKKKKNLKEMPSATRVN